MSGSDPRSSWDIPVPSSLLASIYLRPISKTPSGVLRPARELTPMRASWRFLGFVVTLI